MPRPHEPMTSDEVELYLKAADSLRDAYMAVPRENSFGAESALGTFRAFVGERYDRLAATLRLYVENEAHADAMRRARDILDVATDEDVLQFLSAEPTYGDNSKEE